MADPVFPTAYQVNVIGHLHAQLVENVWHVQGPDPFDATVAADIAATFQTGYTTLLAALSQDYTVEQIVVKNFGGEASGEFTLAIVPPAEGGEGNPALPGNVAFCVSLRSALTGRRFRGRKYIAAIPETAVTGNTIDSTHRSDIVAAIADLRDLLETNLTPMSVFSKTGVTLVPVTAVVSVDNIVDSQRRRLTGRGR